MSRNKKVVAGALPHPKKHVPSLAARPAGFLPAADHLFVVRWTKFDYNGPWCLGKSLSVELVEMKIRIKEMESMTPGEVFQPKGKQLGVDYGPPGNIPNSAARARLTELGLSDETNISRLRITKQARLYGFRRDPEFYAIFWDPEHTIWPSRG